MNSTLSTTNGNNGITGRSLPTMATLYSLVEQELLNQLMQLKAGKIPGFTAYSVTLALRKQNPLLEIEHEPELLASANGRKGVQSIVHETMLNVDQSKYSFMVENHQWGRDGIDDPSGQWARTYVNFVAAPNVVPVTVITANGNSTVYANDPALPRPANVPQLAWTNFMSGAPALPAKTDDTDE